MVAIASTSVALDALRLLMLSANIQSYIVPPQDAHYTEFIAECHQRRQFISGFMGSAGTAVVTETGAYLWTDGRYYLQAEEELDENWELMKDGLPDTPSISEWLSKNLKAGDAVGVDPTLFSKSQWDAMEAALSSNHIQLKPVTMNLIDEIWENKTPCSAKPLLDLDLKFAGISSTEKVTNVRKEMETEGASVLVVTELHEVAWLLNLRGSDLPSSSTFFAYVVITMDAVHFYVNNAQLNDEIRNRLSSEIPDIKIEPYESIVESLKNIIQENPTDKIWFNQNANYALVSLAPKDRLIIKLTPISIMKSVKNDVEVEGYKKSLIRDSAVLAEFWAWLEKQMENGEYVTEISAADKLYEFRAAAEYFHDKSFPTISASGSNGAIIHYMPTEKTDRQLKKEDLYLLDSGGLYYDGTTDITRTVHFGEPTENMKESYTRVLKGQIGLVLAKFPEKTVGHRLDAFARRALWDVGLEYLHGTGHGIGSFLNVHEGPQNIGNRHSSIDPGLRENMFTSNEPGYYEPGEFGIRLENIIRVQKVQLEHNFGNLGFLGFEDLVFVPYQHKLIKFDMLTQKEIDYLNDYQVKTREIVGKYIDEHNMSPDAKAWLMRETQPIPKPGSDSGDSGDSAGSAINVSVRLICALLSLSILRNALR